MGPMHMGRPRETVQRAHASRRHCLNTHRWYIVAPIHLAQRLNM